MEFKERTSISIDNENYLLETNNERNENFDESPLISHNEEEDGITSIEQAFNKAGGLGRFHALLLITFYIVLVTGEVYSAVIMYFNVVPDMQCTYQDGRKERCDWETACNSND